MTQQLGSALGLLVKQRDLSIVVFVMAILAIIIVPLPSGVLDLMLTVSIAVAVLIILISLYIPKPTDLTTFPTLILIITILLSSLVNNAATALVMAPIGLAAAKSLAVSPDPFLMAIAVGASCAFLTPIGHQSNTLVMAPGGYQFGDYWRMGLPLLLLILLFSVPLILWVWPL